MRIPLNAFLTLCFDQVSKGLTEATSALAAAKDDLERAEAQISLSTYMAMNQAIGK